MKKIFFCLLILISSKNLEAEDNTITKKAGAESKKYYKIDSKFLKYLDGVTNRMDGPAIGEVIQVKKLIQDLENGILESKVVGGKVKKELIVFQGTNYTINQLCAMEDQINNDSSKKEELKHCLKQVRHSFIQATIKFMKRIEPAKPIVIKIMEESFRVRSVNQKDTVMIEWANTNGNEEAVFNDRIKTFKEFRKFLNQVSNFLGDLLKSCPEGFKQYMKDNKKS
jgi:hypothetical protein